MKPFIPEHIYIDELSLDDPLTEKVLQRFPAVGYEIIKSANGVSAQKPDLESITKGKRALYLQRNKGPFIERCPGTKDAVCCDYFVANLAVNCHFDCTYCYLQSYLNTQNVTINTNLNDFISEVEALVKANSGQTIRIGTGELADSLALDEITGFSKEIVPCFSKLESALLELKTKGNFIDNLLTVDPKGKTVIAWSLNPQNIIDSDEHKTASLKERIYAAKQCSEAGYKLAFHFDPIILHDGWEENYRSVIGTLFDTIRPESILWISLGVLRFTTAGKTAIQKRFPKTDIVYGEMVRCSDGKMRYIQPVRSDIFKKMRSWIFEKHPQAYVYLCMETPAVWNRVFGEDHSMIREIAHF
jgi:spore photoproduct lyase